MMSKCKSRPFNMRMPEDLREILVAAAQREDRSLASFMLRAALTAAAQGRPLAGPGKFTQPYGEVAHVS
jgi:uncharacterized protein (DUF1778 family)